MGCALRLNVNYPEFRRYHHTICLAKTKALISFTVTAKLICVFVFAYAKSRFSHNEAHKFFEHAQLS